MGEFVLVVDIEVKADSVARFEALIAENARKSATTEPGCRQFDVVRAQDAANRFVLYEVYADLAAFEAHGKTAHVQAFFAEARPLITEQKARRFERIAGATS